MDAPSVLRKSALELLSADNDYHEAEIDRALTKLLLQLIKFKLAINEVQHQRRPFPPNRPNRPLRIKSRSLYYQPCFEIIEQSL